jgi:ethanolamine kinase
MAPARAPGLDLDPPPPPVVADIAVDPAAPDDRLYPALKAAARRLLPPAWARLPDAAVAVERVSGGISNALYKLMPLAANEEGAAKPGAGAGAPGNGAAAAGAAANGAQSGAETSAAALPPPVLVRLYGNGTDKFVDRARELALMAALHARGLGPALLGAFPGGRIEAFLPGRCLEPAEAAAPPVAAAIGAALARFHAAAPAAAGARPAPGAPPATPFARAREWLALAAALDWSDAPEKGAAAAALGLGAWAAELDALEAAAAAAASPPVFAHCDLLAGNIMALRMLPEAEEDGGDRAAAAGGNIEDPAAQSGAAAAAGGAVDPSALLFIDFEYAAWAPRGFDWGNHFCEYAGLDCNYGKYPSTVAEKAPFLRAYLAAARGVAEAEISAAELAAAAAEADVFALAAHAFWAAWAVLQARWSALDFDYLAYAAARWAELRTRRGAALAAAAAAFGVAAP